MEDRKVSYILLLLLLKSSVATTSNAEYIYTYVYGTSLPGEQITYYYRGDIPDLIPIYTHVIDETKLKPGLEKNFTYLKVEYMSPVSQVEIEYFPETYTLKFTIIIPLVPIQFAVAAYALKEPIPNRRHTRSKFTVVYVKNNKEIL